LQTSVLFLYDTSHELNHGIVYIVWEPKSDEVKEKTDPREETDGVEDVCISRRTLQ